MSLLSLCQSVASTIPIAIPPTIEGNEDESAVLMLGLANEAGRWLSKQPDGGWVDSIFQYEFATAATGQITGSIANTGPGGVAQVSGLSSTTPIQPLTWTAFGTGILNNTTVLTVDSSSQVTLNLPATGTLGAGTFQFGQGDYPLPSDFRYPVDNTFWDRSRFWSMRGPQSPQQWQLFKSSVIGRASIQRRFRFRSVGGNMVLSIDPVPTDNGSYLVFEYISTAWCKTALGVPQPLWENDTDVGILDEDLMYLGLKWRLLRRLGMSYAEEMDECERETRRAMAKDGGAAILNLTPSDRLTLIGPWNLPETNFGNVSGS